MKLFVFRNNVALLRKFPMMLVTVVLMMTLVVRAVADESILDSTTTTTTKSSPLMHSTTTMMTAASATHTVVDSNDYTHVVQALEVPTKITNSDIVIPVVEPSSSLLSLSSVVVSDNSYYSYDYNTPRQLEIGDFDTLNQRWATTLVLELNDTTVQDSILGIPLTLDISNIVCNNLAIGDMVWEFQQQLIDNAMQQRNNDKNNNNNNKEPIVLLSNFSIVQFAIDCSVDFSFQYLLLGSSGQAQLFSSNNDLNTSFTLIVPPKPSKNFTFFFTSCEPTINVDELNFIGNSPVTQVLDVISSLLQGTVANQIENEMCTIISQLEERFSTLLSNLTDTLLAGSSSNTTTTSDMDTTTTETTKTNTTEQFLEYEQSMIVPDNIKLINFQDQNSSSNSISTLLDAFSQFSGISLFVTDNSTSNERTNSTTTSNFLDGLFQNGNNDTDGNSITIDLRNNTLLNGEDGFLASLSKPKNNTSDGSTSLSSMFRNPNQSSSSNNQSTGIVYNFFGIKAIRVTNATIKGLSTNGNQATSLLSGFEGIEAIGNYTLAISLTIQEMQVLIDAELDQENVVVDNGGTIVTTMSTDLIQMEFNTSELRIQTAILIAIDEMKLGAVRLGSLLHGQNAIVKCLVPTLYNDLQLTGFIVNTFGINGVAIDGLQSIGMERIITTAFEYFVAALDDRMEDIISTFVSGIDLTTILGVGSSSTNDTDTTSSALVAGNTTTTTETTTTCPAPVPGTGNLYVDYRDLLLPPLQSKLYGGSGTEPYGNLTSSFVNDLLPALSSFTNFTIAGSLFNYTSGFKLGSIGTANIEFVLSNFRFENNGLNNDSSILDVVRKEPFVLNNTISLGNTKMSSTVVFGLQIGTTTNFRNVFNLTIDFNTLTLVVTILAKVLEDKFLQFPIEDILNLNCWLAMFPTPPIVINEEGVRVVNDSISSTDEVSLALQDLIIALDGIFLDVSCLDCSPVFEQATELVRSIDYSNTIVQTVDTIVGILLSNNKSETQTNVVQRELDRLLINAPSRCPHNPLYNSSLDDMDWIQNLINTITSPALSSTSSNNNNDDNSGNAGSLMIGVVVVGFIIALAIMICLWISRRIVHRRFYNKLQRMDEYEIYELYNEQVRQEKRNAELNVYYGSLFGPIVVASSTTTTNKEQFQPQPQHTIVPVVAQYLIPVALIGASILFWCGLFCPSMAVRLYISIASNEPTLFLNVNFALSTFTSEWWNSDAKVLAVLSVLSMIWPQMKIYMTLFIWFVPTSIMSVQTRQHIFQWLHVLGKWSVIVVYIVIVSTSVFQGTIVTNIFEMTFLYIPLFGIYSIILGQILSEVTSKWIMYYHTSIIQSFDNNNNSVGQQQQQYPGLLETVVSSDDTTMNHMLHTKEVSIMMMEAPTSEQKETAGPIKKKNFGRNNSSSVPVVVVDADVLSTKSSLCHTTFTRPHKKEETDTKLQIRPIVQYGFSIVCVLIVTSIIIGCVLPSFQYDIMGIVGVLLSTDNTIDDNDNNSNSTATESSNSVSGQVNVFTIMSKLMTSASVIDQGTFYLGLSFIVIFLIVTVLIVPIVEVGLLWFQWMYPFVNTNRTTAIDRWIQMKSIVTHVEVWQHAEVYFAAVVACGYQLSGISDFFTKVYCKTITNLIRTFIYWGFVDESVGDECIVLEATIYLSSLAFLAAVVGLAFTRGFVNDAIEHKRKEEVEDGRSFSIMNYNSNGSSTPTSINNNNNNTKLVDHDTNDNDNNDRTVSARTNNTCTNKPLLDETMKRLRPTPVHFTDRFRWALCSQRNK